MQPRELGARWRERSSATRLDIVEAMDGEGSLDDVEFREGRADQLDECASELETALAEQDDEIERLKAALDDAERGARSDLETELWAIIDRDGFAGIVPSDIHDAVSRLVKMAEQDGGWVPASSIPGIGVLPFKLGSLVMRAEQADDGSIWAVYLRQPEGTMLAKQLTRADDGALIGRETPCA